MQHRSPKSRPGALKKKEKIVKGEIERLGRSLAQLASSTSKLQAAGDRLRRQYPQLSANPASLANLDQDLPEDIQFVILIRLCHSSYCYLVISS